MAPNGSRLSCGRNPHRRKEPEQIGKLASEATTTLPYLRAPGSFKRMLDSGIIEPILRQEWSRRRNEVPPSAEEEEGADGKCYAEEPRRVHAWSHNPNIEQLH